MKARFTEKQDPVTWNTLPDGKVDVMICLNENIVTETYSGGDPENPEHIEQAVYEYDFNQFREDQKKISEETVRASPENIWNIFRRKKKALNRNLQSRQNRSKC